MWQDAALAVEYVACIALAALHTVVGALTLEADGSTAWLAHAHATLVVAVGRAGDRCKDTCQGSCHHVGAGTVWGGAPTNSSLKSRIQE